MCNLTGIAFGERVLQPADVAGREVLEVGAFDVNGSIRPFVELLEPGRYVGVDIAPGPGVDEVVDASELIERFGVESFDIVITTEMLEHVRPWRTVIHNLKGVLRPGGVLFLTTRSIGFPYHGYPHDFWRYEPEDMQAIFADFDIDTIERDTDAPGVFVIARKPTSYAEKRPALELFSIVTGRRQARISTFELAWFRMTQSLRSFAQTAPKSARRGLHRASRVVRRRVVSPIWFRLPPSSRSAVKRAFGRGN